MPRNATRKSLQRAGFCASLYCELYALTLEFLSMPLCIVGNTVLYRHSKVENFSYLTIFATREAAISLHEYRAFRSYSFIFLSTRCILPPVRALNSFPLTRTSTDSLYDLYDVENLAAQIQLLLILDPRSSFIDSQIAATFDFK